MQEYLIGALLILVGLYFVFFRNSNEANVNLVSNDKLKNASNEENQDDKKEDKKEEEKVEVKKEEDDVDPSLWPNLKDIEINVYFGSQTGTAEKYAHIIKEECRKYLGKICNVVDMEDFDAEEFKQTDLNIILAATHGEGEPTDNALRVHAMMKKASKNGENETFKGVDYTVFGLGDTEYENFWAMGKFFDEKLADLGGNRVFELGMGDTTNDLEADFANWKAKLWPALTEIYKADENAPKENGGHAEENKTKKNNDTRKKSDSTPVKQSLTIRQYIKGADIKIESIREWKQTLNYGSCLEVIYNLEGSELEYNTAANLAVFPTNSEKDVERALAGADGEEQLNDPAFPLPCTLREAFTKYIDLTGPVDRGLIKHLSSHVKDEKEKEELQNINVSEWKDQYLNALDLVEKFKSIEFPAHQKLQVLPKMMPRYYTIASSSLYSPQKVRIAISLTDYELKNGKKFKGLASEYFDNIYKHNFKDGKGDEVKSRIFFKDSLFRLPESTETPLIMIGPGTGVVPFIAFAEEREYLRSKDANAKFGPAHLYFGCRTRVDDYIYKEEISKFKADGVISDVHEAFSREQDNKIYVQDILKNQTSEQVRDLILNQNAYFYICGAMAMGKAVEAILTDIIGAEHAEYLQEMKQSGRYAKELWSG